MSLTVSAQTNNIVILWDASWSMHGLVVQNLGGDLEISEELNIWKQTQNSISQTIENLPLDGSYNVKIIPFEDPNDPTGFNHPIKDIKSLDKIEQEELITWVNNYFGSPVEMRRGTNICQALENVYQDLGNQNYSSNNSILLFSDGGQSAKNSGWNNTTCLDDQLKKFCDIYCAYANQQETNHLYLLKLKYVNSTSDCPDCVSVIDTIKGCFYTNQVILNPAPSSKTILYLEESKNLTIPFHSLGVALPDDFTLSASSSNPRIMVFSHLKYISENNTAPLTFTLNLDEGSEETTIINFEGATNEQCYKFTIKPFRLTVKRQVLSKISIGEIKPIAE